MRAQGRTDLALEGLALLLALTGLALAIPAMLGAWMVVVVAASPATLPFPPVVGLIGVLLWASPSFGLIVSAILIRVIVVRRR